MHNCVECSSCPFCNVKNVYNTQLIYCALIVENVQKYTKNKNQHPNCPFKITNKDIND